ncbi:MAG TPA: peptidoglycan-binding protein, partial [Nannocystaceae bacterium]|nr:peptidoglycan-binding protein [Nannocystaceae bacterium]
DRKRSFNLATAVPHGFQLAPGSNVVIEMEDAHFHFDSAVLLPDATGDADVVGEGGKTTGIAVLAACLAFVRDHPDRKLLSAGHTDTSGDDAYNVELSQLRADGVVAALVGDKDGWVAIAEQKHEVEDYQRILKWVAWLWGWPCDPGPIDGDHGSGTDAAVRSFQELAGDELQEDIAVDGEVGKQTWGAIFSIYMRVLADVLDVDAAGLAELQAAVKWIDKKSVGCGESFPVEARGVDGFKSATNRRVELLFFEAGEEPVLACHPAAKQCDKAQCDLYAPNAYVTQYLPAPPLHLTPVEIQVALTEIAGLYKPGFSDPADVAAGTTKLSGYQPGYKSADDLGRIFVNHIPRTSASVPWQDVRKKDTQYIELAVAVTATAGGRIPAGLRVEWAWEDPDDPSNAAMEAFSSAQVDPNDSGLDPTQDNLGKRDFPTPAADKGAKFEKLDPYGLHETDPSTVDTAIVGGVSKVRLHCTNVGGDNFRVKVGLRAHQLAMPGATDTTGLMTMWKRIDLEYRVMEGADPLPVTSMEPFFAACFVQMDATEPLSSPRIDHLSPLDDTVSDVASQYVKAPPTGVFVNEGKPGWFLLVAAHRAAADVAGVVKKTLFEGTAKVEQFTDGSGKKGERLVVDHAFTEDVGGLKLKEGGKTLGFNVYAKDDDTPSAGKTTLYIVPIDYQGDFVPGDGRIGGPGQGGAYDRRKFYYPRHVRTEPGNAWTVGGLGFPAEVEVEVLSRGAETAGISPDNAKGGKSYFAGRTIVFTKHPKFNESGSFDTTFALTVITHEIGHAYGFPHKCGYNTWEDPPTTSCTMNYSVTWLYEPGTRDVQRFFPGTMGQHMCARHLHGIRMVHLEDNPAMWTWP